MSDLKDVDNFLMVVYTMEAKCKETRIRGAIKIDIPTKDILLTRISNGENSPIEIGRVKSVQGAIESCSTAMNALKQFGYVDQVHKSLTESFNIFVEGTTIASYPTYYNIYLCWPSKSDDS
jgi:hypothetical protein